MPDFNDPLLAGFVEKAGGPDRAIALLRERYAIKEWADLLVYLEGDQ
jgi:hypothetical protein